MLHTGLLTIEPSKKARVDLPTKSMPNDALSFNGRVETCKEEECLLLFDPDRQEFRLERMEMVVKNLRHDRRGGALAAKRLLGVSYDQSLPSSSTKHQRRETEKPAPVDPWGSDESFSSEGEDL